MAHKAARGGAGKEAAPAATAQQPTAPHSLRPAAQYAAGVHSSGAVNSGEVAGAAIPARPRLILHDARRRVFCAQMLDPTRAGPT